MGNSFDRDKFFVVTMISNPVRYESRIANYFRFKKKLDDARINLFTVEVQTGDRPFVITDPHNVMHLQLRHWEQLWIKENALNLGVCQLSKIYPDWETLAWMDADTELIREDDWVTEALHMLQIYQVIQLFETSVDLGPTGDAILVRKSFMSEYLNGNMPWEKKKYGNPHTGYAWACRREAYEGMGGFMSRAILGSADWHQAFAFVGKSSISYHPDSPTAYQRYVKAFEERCTRSIRMDVGCMSGTILHYWHGKKVDRRYWDRWKILIDNNYDPYIDIKANAFGVWELHDDGSMRFIKLRDAIRQYMSQRNEDTIEK